MSYVADRARVVIAWSRYGWRVIIESQATIESDAENKQVHVQAYRSFRFVFSHTFGWFRHKTAQSQHPCYVLDDIFEYRSWYQVAEFTTSNRMITLFLLHYQYVEVN